MIFGSIDSAAKDAASIFRGLRAGGAWFAQKTRGDHSAISACYGMDHPYAHRFAARVCAAPSRAVKPLPDGDFPARAQAVALRVLENLQYVADYSGPDLVRFVVKDGVEQRRSQRHLLEVRSSGLIDLRWGLEGTIQGDEAGPLPLTEVIGVIHRIHRVVQGAEYRNLHQQRVGETRRRVDWRIGITGTVSTDTGQVPWTCLDVLAAGTMDKAENRWPYCPSTGFAASSLQSLKPRGPAGLILRAVLESMFSHAGYLNPRACVREVERLIPLDR